MTAAEMIVLIVMLDAEWILQFPPVRGASFLCYTKPPCPAVSQHVDGQED